MIYLDYSANTPVAPEVLECFVKTERNYIGNPNAAHPVGLLSGGQRQALTLLMRQ